MIFFNCIIAIYLSHTYRRKNMTYLEKALKNEDAHLSGEGKAEKITYVALNRTERYVDPEEKVRAEYWAELIYRYGYDLKHIKVEVRVPDRIPNDIADLVIFHEYDQTRPYAVIEFKRDDITDSEFEQAVEQGVWKRNMGQVSCQFCWGGRRSDTAIPRFLSEIRSSRTRGKYRCRPSLDGMASQRNSVFGKGLKMIFPLLIKRCSFPRLKNAIRPYGEAVNSRLRRLLVNCVKLFLSKSAMSKTSRKNGEPYQFQIKTHEPSEQTL